MLDADSPSESSSTYSVFVAESVPPVAIRVARPYATEDELLENELETLTRTSITLLGAPPRPQGLVLRFELLLSEGQVLARGEGRVVGYRPDAYYGLGGLTLRFTRLDTRSKALVDRAAAMRERRRHSSTGGFGEAPFLPSPSIQVEGPADDGTREERASTPPREPSVAEGISPRAPPPTTATIARDDPPSTISSGDRDALLQRLRARSKALDGDVLRKIFERGR